MRLLKQSTARNVMVFMSDATDRALGKAGLTLTITASKDGGAFASISPTVTDRGSGFYNLALTTSHTDTLGDLALHITGSGADATDTVMQVVAGLPGEDSATISGIDSKIDTIDNFLDTEIADIKAKTDNLPSDPADASDIAAAFTTTVNSLKGIAKNTALSGFQFAMFDDAGDLATGLTVAVEISKDGGAFAASVNSPVEISDGWYKINFEAAEMNAKSIAVRAAAAGAKDTVLVITTDGV